MKRLAFVGVLGVVAACGGGSSGSVDGGADALVVDGTGGGADGPGPGVDGALTTTSTWVVADGLPDQLDCAPWVLNDTSEPEQPTIETELVLENDVNGETMFYSHSGAVLTMPATLVVEGSVEFVSSTAEGPSRTSTHLGVTLANDQKNFLQIREGEIFLLTAENTVGPTAAVDTSDAVHTYRMEITTATGAIEVFRDGTSVLTGAMFASSNDEQDLIYWGEASIGAHGSSRWTAVSHNALTPVACD